MSIPNIQWPWRDGVNAISYNGYIVMLGGWNPTGGVFTPGPSTNEIWISSDNGLNWTLLGNAPWSARHTFGTILKGSVLYVIGGDPFNPAKDIWTYDLTQGVPNLAVSLNWTQQTNDWGATGGVRYIQSYYIYNNKIRMAGGQDSFGVTPTMYTDVVELNESTWTWSNVGALPISDASTCIFIQSGSITYMYAGGRYQSAGHDNPNFNLYKSLNGGSTWALVGALPIDFIGFMYANGILFDNKLFLLSGDGGAASPGNKKGLWYYDIPLNKWVRIEAPLSRHACAIIEHSSSIYIISGNTRNDVVKYSKVTV